MCLRIDVLQAGAVVEPCKSLAVVFRIAYLMDDSHETSGIPVKQ